jgi:hypothetical protein
MQNKTEMVNHPEIFLCNQLLPMPHIHWAPRAPEIVDGDGTRATLLNPAPTDRPTKRKLFLHVHEQLRISAVQTADMG